MNVLTNELVTKEYGTEVSKRLCYDCFDVAITNHAYDRGKERFGLPKKALKRMAQKVFYDGLKEKDMSGALYSYFHEKGNREWNLNMDYRIYGEILYVFSKEKNIFNNLTHPLLVTVTYIPQELRTQARGQFKKKKEL